MPTMPLNRLVLYLTLCLALLFAVLEPEPSRGFAFGWALIFWLAHIGGGLLLALVAAKWLTGRIWLRQWPALLQVSLAGLIGSMAFAPLALGLESLLSVAPEAGPLDDWMDDWELAGGWRKLVAEWLQLLPSYFSAWMLINALPLVQLAERQRTFSDSLLAAGASEAASTVLPVGSQPIAVTQAVPDQIPAAAAQAFSQTSPALSGKDWLDQLPPAIGRRLLRIEADLHYLNVYTQGGRAMLLGSLAAVATELGPAGVRVHRSHWVAIDQVQRVLRNGQGWYCELRDGSRVPVSRRRAREVHERLGRDFVAN